jgi:hypothetical protein
MHLRPTLVTIAVGATAGALAFTAPVVARSAFDARNAHRVDGLHAAQLTKIQGFSEKVAFDNFDTCGYTSVLTRTFKAPHAGVIAVTGQVGAARDSDVADAALLTARVVIDGKRTGGEATVSLTVAGTQGGSVNPLGSREVKAGNHVIEIQAEECSSGAAFIQAESMIVSFSAFGSAPKPRPAKSGR